MTRKTRHMFHRRIALIANYAAHALKYKRTLQDTSKAYAVYKPFTKILNTPNR